MANQIGFGILGCGSIADRFVSSLREVPDSRLVAVASRTPGKADGAAHHWQVNHAYSSYEELLVRSDIDAVYVATTHNFHYECALAALEHGKAVLCEKPFTVNARQAEDLINLAQSKKLFLMEAMWTRFLPVMGQVRAWLAEEAIGTIKQVRADFGFCTPFNAESRLYNAALAGGAMLDVGIYPISFASMVMGGKPHSIEARANLSPTGIDEQSSYLFGYAQGAIAMLSSAVGTNLPNRADIIGTKGTIALPENFFMAKQATLQCGRKRTIKKFPSHAARDFKYEIREMVRCLKEGLTESSLLPLSETLAIMQTMDTIRQKIGVRYECDGAP